MAGYVKCPRCDLNYISEEQEYCDVCKAELKKGPKLLFANDDEEEIDAEATELCPICKQNYIRANEEMCMACREEAGARREDELDVDKDESWKEFLDDDKDDYIEDVSFGAFADEEESETDSYTGEVHSDVKEEDDFDDIPEDVELPDEDDELLEEDEDEEE